MFPMYLSCFLSWNIVVLAVIGDIVLLVLWLIADDIALLAPSSLVLWYISCSPLIL